MAVLQKAKTAINITDCNKLLKKTKVFKENVDIQFERICAYENRRKKL